MEPTHNEPLYNKSSVERNLRQPITVEPRHNEPLHKEVLGITKSKTAN